MDAMNVNGGDVENATTSDYVMHFLTFGFKVKRHIFPVTLWEKRYIFVTLCKKCHILVVTLCKKCHILFVTFQVVRQKINVTFWIKCYIAITNFYSTSYAIKTLSILLTTQKLLIKC